jgi:hypothetical protein
MRDVTRSMLSLSWALSLLGFKQVADLAMSRGPQQWDKLGSSFEPVTRVAVDQLDDDLKTTFRAGNDLMNGMTDLMFSMFSMGGMSQNRFVKTAAGAFRSAAGAATGGCPTSAPPGDGQDKTGWGPVPSPDGR